MKTTSPASSLAPESAELPDSVELMEERMRRALGLGGPGAQRTMTLRTSSPGPVERNTATAEPSGRRASRLKATDGQADALSLLHGRIAELEQHIATERQGHEATRRQVQQAEATVHALDARLQREAVARADELEAVRQGGIAAQRARDDALFSMQQRKHTKATGAHTVTATSAAPSLNGNAPTQARQRASEAQVQAASEPPRKRGRPSLHPLPEPKPVRWWTPSYRAAGKRKD